MKKSMLLLTALVLCCASVVSAQVYPLPGGAIGVYADDQGTSCDVPGAGLVQFHFFHLACPGATAIEFKLDITGFVYSMNLGDQTPFTLKLGTFIAGASISYQACLLNTIYLGAATFLGTGTTPACTKVYVKNHPIPGQAGATNPLAVGCPTGWIQVAGSYAVVNNTGGCPCTGSTPVEETSWGQIKALYE
ncbi:MAG: hypothetical protein HY770_02620 [Chitinivibrionia bacterium]|nr:hypothetical protein [Chitinivibrionia bacterium]